MFLYYLICICHDNSHMGKNNNFYEKINHDFAY